MMESRILRVSEAVKFRACSLMYCWMEGVNEGLNVSGRLASVIWGSRELTCGGWMTRGFILGCMRLHVVGPFLDKLWRNIRGKGLVNGWRCCNWSIWISGQLDSWLSLLSHKRNPLLIRSPSPILTHLQIVKPPELHGELLRTDGRGDEVL